MACASLNQPADTVAVATVLLAKGANVEARDMAGNAALDEAQGNDRKDLAAVLTAKRATRGPHVATVDGAFDRPEIVYLTRLENFR